MEISHLSRSWMAAGIVSAVFALGLASFFAVDVIGEYFVNTSYFFALGWWYEFAIATVSAAAGAIVAIVTYWRR